MTNEYEIRDNEIGERCATVTASSADAAVAIWGAQPDDGHTDRTVPVHAVRVR
ncbi:MAG: hypothetical protein WCE30_10160 [Mycobacterium sp.]